MIALRMFGQPSPAPSVLASAIRSAGNEIGSPSGSSLRVRPWTMSRRPATPIPTGAPPKETRLGGDAGAPQRLARLECRLDRAAQLLAKLARGSRLRPYTHDRDVLGRHQPPRNALLANGT
jgi:hypothetical protein